MSADSEAKITKALSDMEIAKGRATMALKAAHKALRLSLSTPRIRAILKESEKGDFTSTERLPPSRLARILRAPN